MRLIDGNALYEKACDLEAQALDYTVKISNDEEKREEWLRWSAILAERTAFKHDVYDAPTIEPEPRWIPCGERLPDASERMPYKRGEVSSEWVLVSMVDCGRPDDEVVKIGRYSYEPRLWPDDGKARGWVVANGQYGKVTAWLPLPAPYKEDTE